MMVIFSMPCTQPSYWSQMAVRNHLTDNKSMQVASYPIDSNQPQQNFIRVLLQPPMFAIGDNLGEPR